MLAELRARAVAKAITAGGLPANAVSIEALGQQQTLLSIAGNNGGGGEDGGRSPDQAAGRGGGSGSGSTGGSLSDGIGDEGSISSDSSAGGMTRQAVSNYLPSDTDPVAFVVHFDADETQLDPVAEAVVAEARAAALKHRNVRIAVVGNADSLVGEGHSTVLAELRTRAVAKAMMASGIPADAVSIKASAEKRALLNTTENLGAVTAPRVEVLIESPPKQP